MNATHTHPKWGMRRYVMVKFDEWYAAFKQELQRSIIGKGAFDEPVISKETLQRLITQQFGSDPRTIKHYIRAMVLNGKLHPYPSGKQYSFLDDGSDTPESVMQKLRQQQEAVKP